MIRSLRGRLFTGLTAIIVLTGAAGGTLAYLWAYNEAIEMQDSVLTQIGTFAMNASTRQSQPVGGVDAESEVVLLELGPMPHGSADDRRLWTLHDGLHDDVRHGRQIRVSLWSRPDGSRFAVAQGDEIRVEIAGDMAIRTLLPFAALVPCLLLVTALVIGRSFRPVFRLAEELDVRRADDLRLLPGESAPSELQPFLGSINGLLERIRAMVEQQRRFVADAAHELRTPITALSLQAQNLDPLDMSPAARDRLEALKSGMRRTRHLLDQLLALARQDLASSEVKETVHLDRTAMAVVADLLAEASARNVDLGFTVAEPVSVSADPVAMVSVVRNVVENAVRYTPDGGRVDVGVYRESGQAVLQIEDTGPGVPPQDVERIVEPFYRGRRPTGDGSGLGLSIVKRFVDRYGGSMEFKNLTGADQTGLRVIVRLPALD
ncbi:ATP-binding protein [Bradyrhizobium betae]|nr:ATP-binding protein [Bradyrhizobium betae]